MSRRTTDGEGRYVRKMGTSVVVKSNGEHHRSCRIFLPRDFTDAYPDGQYFVITQEPDGRLVLTPVPPPEEVT